MDYYDLFLVPSSRINLELTRHLQVTARCFTPRYSHLFTFSPFHFCFPALPKDQPLRGSLRNIAHMYMGYYDLFLVPSSRIDLELTQCLQVAP